MRSRPQAFRSAILFMTTQPQQQAGGRAEQQRCPAPWRRAWPMYSGLIQVQHAEHDDRHREQDALADLRLRDQHAEAAVQAHALADHEREARPSTSARLPPVRMWIASEAEKSFMSALLRQRGRAAQRLVEAHAHRLLLADLGEDPADRRRDLLRDELEGGRAAGGRRAGRARTARAPSTSWRSKMRRALGDALAREPDPEATATTAMRRRRRGRRAADHEASATRRHDERRQDHRRWQDLRGAS